MSKAFFYIFHSSAYKQICSLKMMILILKWISMFPISCWKNDTFQNLKIATWKALMCNSPKKLKVLLAYIPTYFDLNTKMWEFIKYLYI